MHRLPFILTFFLLVPSSFAGAQQGSAPAPVNRSYATRTQTHPTRAQTWRETDLYFALGPADDPSKGITEAEWRKFLDAEVTLRFPSGFSVADVYGQWQTHPDTPIERLRSKMLILAYPDTPTNAASVEAIRSAWKRNTGDISVLRITRKVQVAF